MTWGCWQQSLLYHLQYHFCYSKATQDTQYPPYAILKAELQMQAFAKNAIFNILMLPADRQVLRVSKNTWSSWNEKPLHFQHFLFFFYLLPASVYIKETNKLQ